MLAQMQVLGNHDQSVTHSDGILSVRRLASILEISTTDLEKLASEAGRYYSPFDRRKVKSSGKWRHIDNPKGLLKMVQARVQRAILAHYPLPARMVGGVAGRSIVDHAQHHVRQPLIVLLDIRECYPSLNHKRVFNCFRSVLGCSTDVASALTRLTSFQYRLPQGAPTSPTIANMILLDLYTDIANLSARLGLEYSLYVDDIAVSGAKAIQAIEPIGTIIKKHGLRLSWRKVKVLPSNRTQEITGLQVNHRVDISHKKVSQLKSDILALADSPIIFNKDLQSIRGRISNIKYINLVEGSILESLANQHLPSTGLSGGMRKGEVRDCSKFGGNHSG